MTVHASHRSLIPPKLLDRVLAFTAGEHHPAEPRNAATLVLLRPGAGGVELYLLRRQATMAFASGMCVFPGGGVDERDFDTDIAWAGPAPADWAQVLGTDDDHLARALVCAAVRETFEESGVLLAGPSAEEVVADTTAADWEADRMALETRELSLTELLTRRGLVLRTDLLGAWSGWLTPEFEPRRFRTWFFVAALPEGQVTRDVASESDQVLWIGAAEAARRADLGEVVMMPPTFWTCLDVSRYGTPERVLAESGHRRVEMFTPALVHDSQPPMLSLPVRYQALRDQGIWDQESR